MMGHREKLRGGDEYDYLTRARRMYGHPSDAPRIKRQFWKRMRAKLRAAMRRLRP